MEKLLFTVEEAGEALSLSRTVVYDLMARGLLESVVIGRCRRIPAEALKALVETLRQGLDMGGHPSARMRTG
jgi:excisionase family DNA binding protein